MLCNPRDPVMRIGMWSVSKATPPPRGQALTIAQHAISAKSMLYGYIFHYIFNNAYKDVYFI